MRRLRAPVLAAAVAVSLWAACTEPFASAALPDDLRAEMISRFLASRRTLNVACLYTFDRISAPTNTSSPSKIDFTGDDALLATDPPTFQEHIGLDCPFGDLQFDPDLVTSLDDGTTTRQLGVRLAPDPNGDVRRPQVASNDVVGAKDFYSAAMDHGFSVEFTYRRRAESNQTLTLFSISNRFRSCVDPGFRVDLISTHVIMLVFFYPVLVGDDIACYERRLFSARVGDCALPHYRQIADENPVVHVVVTVRGVHAEFFVKFVDPVTFELHECLGKDSAPLPEEPISYDYIQGSYRLFIGNNPRNVSSPLRRSAIAPIRQYRNPKWDDRPAEERLRGMIKQKLTSIEGPRVPASFRLFGGKSVSFSLFGVPLPPVSEDTPFKWIRNKVLDFKQEHGDEIANFIVKGLKEGNKSNNFGSDIITDNSASTADEMSSNILPQVNKGIYPNANSSAFDLFHFVIYRSPIAAGVVKREIWKEWMMPFRPFLDTKKVIRIDENEETVLELLQLHSIYDDVKIELLDLPKLGKLFLLPHKIELTLANLNWFRNLSMEEQQKLLYVSKSNKTNVDVGGLAFGQKADPYSVVRYRASGSVVGRLVNTTHEAVIEIFVDRIEKPLATRYHMLQVDDRIPVYANLVGETTSNEADTSDSSAYARQLGLFDGLEDSGFEYRNTPTTLGLKVHPTIRITQLPKYGHLYDRQMENLPQMKTIRAQDPNQMEPYRVRRGMIENQSFSTSAVYIFDSSTVNVERGCIDTLEYKLQAETPSEDDTLKYDFLIFPSPSGSEHNTSATVLQVEEDSAIVLLLSSYDLLSPGTRLIVEHLPKHGSLFHWLTGQPITVSDDSIGFLTEISGEVTSDVRGRMLYVPDPDYSNTVGMSADLDGKAAHLELDGFNYSISSDGECVHRNHCQLSSRSIPPVFNISHQIRFQVENTPDELAVLPPTTFFSDGARGDAVNVPVTFVDPDRYSGAYRVTLRAKDEVSEFEIGHAVSNDDVLRFCPFTRPCWLVRSANASFGGGEYSDEREDKDWQLVHLIETRYWDPSFIDIRGKKEALQHALQQLRFRDKSMSSWSTPHYAQFTFTIERAGTSLDSKVTATYCVSYLPRNGRHESDSIGQALSNLLDVVSFALWMVALCFILSSASCCSPLFWCCFTRAKVRKTHQFNEDRRRYVEQVVQNDYEYTSLLAALQEVIEHPNLCARLVLICGDAIDQQRTLPQVLCLQSVTPLLHFKQAYLQFVRNLISAEVEAHCYDSLDNIFSYPSLAGLAIAQHLAIQGKAWLRKLQYSLSTEFDELKISHLFCTEDLSSHLLALLEIEMDSLPNDVCRACRDLAEFISSASEHGTLLEAAHIVFFNHFVAPSLWNIKGPRYRKTVRIAVGSFASLRLTKSQCSRYRSVLEKVLTSSSTQTSFVVKSEVDGRLIALCLMNLHSILESILPDLELDEMKHRATGDTTSDQDVDIRGEVEHSRSMKIRRILRALNFPIANCSALLEASQGDLQVQELLWTGFSTGDWERRLKETKGLNAQPPQRKLQQSTSLLSVDFNECMPESSLASTCSNDRRSRVEFEF